MTLDHTLTGLAVSAILGITAALVILWAGACLTVCRAIEARRRLSHPTSEYAEDDTAAQAGHDPAATQVQAWLDAINDLEEACCERWWTSLATDHDPTCPNQTRKEPR